MSRRKRTKNGGERSLLVKANTSSDSLRTTVPQGIVGQLALQEGDCLVWRVKSGKGDDSLSLEVTKEGDGDKT